MIRWDMQRASCTFEGCLAFYRTLLEPEIEDKQPIRYNNFFTPCPVISYNYASACARLSALLASFLSRFRSE